MKKLLGIALTLMLALTLCLSTIALANDEESSSMNFEGLIEDWGSGEYSGTLDMTAGEYYVPGGTGECTWDQGGFDVYALEGGTTYVEGIIPDNWVIGDDHDAYSQGGPWGTWYDPDCADCYQYSLDLNGGTWALRYTATGESPMSGTIDLVAMYAWESDPGTVKGVHGGNTTDPTEYLAGSAQEWGWHCGWGEERIPLEYPGFTITVIHLGSGIYRVVMIPASAPPPPPPPYVGSGTPFDQFNGQFMVDMFCPNNAQGYNWVEGCDGKTLAEPVEQVATFCYKESTTYGLQIPEGTVVEGYYGGRVQQFTLEIVEGKFCFSPPTKFSKAVTLYELDGETWIEILRFDQVDAYDVTSLSPEVVAID